jgi:hypothetical protein
MLNCARDEMVMCMGVLLLRTAEQPIRAFVHAENGKKIQIQHNGGGE